MKVEKRDGSIERRVLIGMIVDKAVLGTIASRWKKNLFRSRWANIIAEWCVTFFEKYSKAPRKSIEGLFESWSSEPEADKETVQLVERFLESLSGEYAELKKASQSDYLIDLAGKHFNQVAVERLSEQLQGDIDGGALDKAQQRITKFARVEMGLGSGIDVLNDHKALEDAFMARREPIIKYPGALGNFFGDALERDGFIAFMGPEKRGKTWWLIDLAWRAMLQGRRVAFFEVGDMSRNQIMRRFMIRATKRPFKPTDKDAPLRYPTFIEHPADNEPATVDLEERHFKNEMTLIEAQAAMRRLVAKKSKRKDMLLMLDCYPNSTLTVPGIAAVLDNWERREWVPDVVVVDYADILAPINNTAQTRDQINATWAALRSLSQQLHCLVVTATQADAASYSAETMDRSNFTDDKRKYAHVTGMIGINATAQEKESGVVRLNWLVLREGEFTETKCVHVAGCLGLANPAVLSTF